MQNNAVITTITGHPTTDNITKHDDAVANLQDAAKRRPFMPISDKWIEIITVNFTYLFTQGFNEV